MSDDNNTNNTPDLSQLTARIEQLTTELEQAKATIAERDSTIQELQGSTGGLKTSNNQLTTKVTELERQLADANQTIETQTGELTSWSTKYEQLQGQHNELNSQAAADQQQLELYGLIAGDPKYHGLIGVVDAIKTDSDPDAQKQILDKMAAGFQSQTNQALDDFRAGGTRPAGNDAGTQPGGSLPTDAKQAFTEYQSLLNDNSPDAVSRRAALYEVITAQQFGENPTQQN